MDHSLAKIESAEPIILGNLQANLTNRKNKKSGFFFGRAYKVVFQLIFSSAFSQCLALLFPKPKLTQNKNIKI